ncbi:MAG: endopeptidase La, partial [Ramlibacter sp.]|nr:endopeptidase La [Ramlibacter sp.]
MSDDTPAWPIATRPIPEDAVLILPVRHAVLFPGTLQPLVIDRPASQLGVQEAVRLERPVGLLLQKNMEQEEPGPADLHTVGTTAAVLRYVTTPDGAHHAIVRGMQRFRVLRFLEGWPFLVAQVLYMPDVAVADPEVQGRALALKQRALETLQLLPQVPVEMVAAIQAMEHPEQIGDIVAGVLDISADEKQALLETFDLKQRLDKLLQVLAHRIEVLKVQRDVSERTRESIGHVNRKQLLREQLRTIQRELGEGD